MEASWVPQGEEAFVLLTSSRASTICQIARRSEEEKRKICDFNITMSWGLTSKALRPCCWALKLHSHIYLRNDMDTVGIRAGCTLLLFSNSDFNGNSVSINAYATNDRWVVLAETAGYQYMAEDVESLQCVCRA
eukprot:GFUD01065977.1.p1 GENE.GFUD01065977.1~~GFUD01065977.1.p1  ORF type:complete len:134 (+),score=16.43 GFUD01065977.1:60-461(+)